jgi:ectoine hydroxylase-related dioxygenase (phytanoyl-CoA dioxygenase family)
MTLAEKSVDSTIDVAAHLEALQRDGITAQKGAFSRDWIEQMREDMLTAFWSAIQRPGGAISRGPRRWYVAMHPEQLTGFVDLVTHPFVVAMSEAVCGPNYQFVEVGFDVPFQGAKNQPWHRDFASPEETWRDQRITSLAFNLTGVDVTEDMGPFEIAQGTQFDDGREWKHEMFPPKDIWPRFAEKAVRKFPKMGDISCRTALTVHRGTQHDSPIARPVLILGVVSGDLPKDESHDLFFTREFYDSLPEGLRDHLRCKVVDELEPLVQKHDIEGLVMGVE